MGDFCLIFPKENVLYLVQKVVRSFVSALFYFHGRYFAISNGSYSFPRALLVSFKWRNVMGIQKKEKRKREKEKNSIELCLILYSYCFEFVSK